MPGKLTLRLSAPHVLIHFCLDAVVVEDEWLSVPILCCATALSAGTSERCGRRSTIENRSISSAASWLLEVSADYAPAGQGAAPSYQQAHMLLGAGAIRHVARGTGAAAGGEPCSKQLRSLKAS